jgi:hypothetical protein
MSIIQNYYQSQFKLDPNVVAENLVRNFYYIMSTTGLSKLLHIFTNDCNCSINNINLIGAINLFVLLTESDIKRFNYNQIQYATQIISNDSILVSVTGYIQLFNSGNISDNIWKRFTETFIVKYINGNLYVTNHIFYIFNNF